MVVDRPALPGSPDDGLGRCLPVAAVARRLGVAPATLRTWDRRYGLGPGAHTAGAHRRYAAEDVARLETMRRLTLEGVPPAEAARAALVGGQTVPQHDPRPPAGREGRLRRAGSGGRVLALPGAPATVVGLGRASMALDSTSVLATVRTELAQNGVAHTWEHVLRPVLVAVGARWAATGEGVEVEHLLSECITAALREVWARQRLRDLRAVLLVSAPGEPHTLPLHVVGACLAERGLGSRVLGGSLPVSALHAAVRRTGAAALFVWSQVPATGSPETLAAVPVTRPPTAVVAGGPGWDVASLPRRVAVAHTLHDAVELVSRATGA